MQLSAEESEVIRQQGQAGAYELDVQMFYILEVPLTFHAIRKADGTGAIRETTLATVLQDINAGFAGTGIQFVRPGPTVVITSDAFYSDIDTLAEIYALWATNPVANTVNIYFPNSLATANGTACGVASLTSLPVQGVVIRKNCAGVANNPSTAPHEVGHYFDLLHTHETVYGAECVDGSNCGNAGDLLCDTPADPVLDVTTNMDAACLYTGTETDG